LLLTLLFDLANNIWILGHLIKSLAHTLSLCFRLNNILGYPDLFPGAYPQDKCVC
jgi:hypothetical protein